MYADRFDQYPGLSRTAAVAEQWHKARAQVGRDPNGSSALPSAEAKRRVDEEFRRRLDKEVSQSEVLRGIVEGYMKLKRTPSLLNSHILEVEKDEADLRMNVTIIPDSEAALLGPSVAYHVVEFRQKNRDAYATMASILRYVRDAAQPTDTEVAPYVQLHLRGRVEADRAYYALRDRVEMVTDMGLMRLSLLQFAPEPAE